MAEIARRKKILAAASQSFAQFGYKATTMEAVARNANVGKGTIYTFFSTKDELFEEILQAALTKLMDILEKEVREDEPFFQNLLRVLEALYDFRSNHELFIKLSQEVQDIGTEQARSGIYRLESLVLEYLGNQFRRAIAAGEARRCEPALAAFMMLKLYMALAMEWSRTREPLNKEQIKESIGLFIGKLA